MDANQLIQNQISTLLSANEIYTTYRERWEFAYQSYLGGEVYTEAGHLTKYQLETPREYDARLKTTPLENHCKSVVSVYNSFLFRESPYRDLGSLERNPMVQEFLKDADQDGRSLNEIMREVSTWSSVFGHCWLLLSKPNLQLATQADEMEAGVRPYLNMLTPLAVTDWNWYRTPIGKYKLDYFKYTEDFNGSYQTIKEWYPDMIITTTVDVEKENIVERIEEPNELGWIPVVCAYNQRSQVRGIGVSDIQDIAYAQKMIYNCTSEAVEAIKLDTHPSIVATPNTNLGVGPGSVIQIEENLDPGLKPYALEFSGASIESIYKSIEHTTEAIDKMANTGAVRANESRTMSGVAMEVEFSLLNARLSQKAGSLQLAEEQMWKIMSYYLGTTWDGDIEYPNSFNIRDKSSEIQQLRTAKETATNDKVLAAIDRQLVEWMELEEEIEILDFEPHVMEDPQTGERRIARTEEEHLELAAQGWIHPGEETMDEVEAS